MELDREAGSWGINNIFYHKIKLILSEQVAWNRAAADATAYCDICDDKWTANGGDENNNNAVGDAMAGLGSCRSTAKPDKNDETETVLL